MKVLNPKLTLQVIRQDPEEVRQILEKGRWQIGQPEDPEDPEAFRLWLAAGEGELLDGDALMAHALAFFSKRHPNANARDIASAATLLVSYATGWYGGFGTEEYAKQRWAARLIMNVLGISGDGDPMYFVPQSLMGEAPSEQQTLFVLRLLDGLYFTAKPESETQATIRQVIDLLAATKGTFKSKQIERARELLEGALAEGGAL